MSLIYIGYLRSKISDIFDIYSFIEVFNILMGHIVTMHWF